MKLKRIILFIFFALFYGCGEEGDSKGQPSSFTEGNGDPIFENVTATNFEQNISSVVTEKNGEYKIYVNENQKTAFKMKATDKSNLSYSISEGDWQDFDVDSEGGNFAFKKFTDFETKKEYHFILIAKDAVGNKTRKKATIYVNDDKHEKALPRVVNNNNSLVIDSEREYFITTWKTDNNSTLHSNQITIPTFGDGYYYSVDWGDGTSSKNIIEDITHTYKKSGTYKVKILGKFSRIYFADGTDNYGNVTNENNFKLISIDQWGDIEWNSMASAFIGCVNLTGKFSDTPNLSNVRDMSSMFYNAVSFNQNIANWNVSHVINMYSMFSGANSFNQDISAWNVSNVTNMSYMFSKAESFNQSIGTWNVSKVINMNSMFFKATAFNQNIGNWNVSNVLDMSNMFSRAVAFNQNLNNWNVSSVRDMGSMFDNAYAFNQNIGNWNVSNVTNMRFMFNKAIVFNQDIGNWNVSKVINMDSLFSDTTRFNQDIGRWNVSSVKNMRWMFFGAKNFNQYIGGWNVSNVTDMNSMFIQAEKFNQNISGWNVSQVINMRRMFKFATSFNQNLENWNVVSFGDSFFKSFDGTFFYGREDMFYGAFSMRKLPWWYANLSNTAFNYNAPLPQSDEQSYFITTWKTDGVGVISNSNQITIPTVFGPDYLYRVDWGDGTSSSNITRDITHVYKKAGTYRVKIKGLFPRIHFGKDFYENAIDDNNMKIVSIDQWGDNQWASMAGAFAGCGSLKINAVDKPDLSNVTDTNSMFYSSSINEDIANWDVSNVTNMWSMFRGAFLFNQNINTWNVSNVVTMDWMFSNATSFNKNIGNWDVSNVRSMFTMFYGATSFNKNIGNWNVSNVTDMAWMFSTAISFNQNIGNWNVSNVTDMRFMFHDAQSFNQVLENWDVSNVKQITTVDGGKFSAMLGMFDRTPLDEIPSWFNVEYKNKLNLKSYFLKKTYFNNEDDKNKKFKLIK